MPTRKPSAHNDIHDHVALLMKSAGQRYTTKRKDIVGAMVRLGQPAGIPELLRLVDDLPQSSLYRNLTVLQDAGVVARVMSSQDGGLYELAEHITGHHHHLLCSQCGVVKDVVVPDALEHDLDTTLAKLAKREGFALDRHRLDLIGRCASCQ